MVPASDVAALFDWAQRHALALFPIRSWSKQPWGIIRRFSKEWSKDPAQWRSWWETHRCNFGVVCGPSRIIVVDVDTDDKGDPRFDARWVAWANGDLFCVRTPSGGWHLYCRVPEGVDSTALGEPDWADGIETRAGNGYVVSPFSVTRTGVDADASDGAYAISKDCAALPLAPQDLLDLCKKDDAPLIGGLVRPEEFDEDGYPVEPGIRLQVKFRMEQLVAVFRKAIPNHNRNKLLNVTAFELGQIAAAGQIDYYAIEMILREEALLLGLKRHEIRCTLHSAFNGSRNKPAPLKPSMQAMFAAVVPTQPRAELWSPTPVCGPAGEPLEPIVERLLIEGCVTVLSGELGSGKTTLGASLMAASAAGLRNFTLPTFGAAYSDVIARAAAWVFVSYEGGQFMDLHRRAWHDGVGVAEAHPERRVMLSRRGCLVFSDLRRNAVFNQAQWNELIAAIDAIRRANPGLPVVVAIDNVTSAVEDPTDQMQAAAFMRAMRTLADNSIAILLFAHPPKSGSSAVYGSHIFFSLADIVGILDAVRRDLGEWTQWIDFEKHRMAPNGRALELKSRKLLKPIMDLPPDWGGDARGRSRALDDLRTPFIYQICVRWESEKPAVKAGVTRVSEVTQKPAAHLTLVANGPPFGVLPFDGAPAP